MTQHRDIHRLLTDAHSSAQNMEVLLGMTGELLQFRCGDDAALLSQARLYVLHSAIETQLSAIKRSLDTALDFTDQALDAA